MKNAFTAIQLAHQLLKERGKSCITILIPLQPSFLITGQEDELYLHPPKGQQAS